MNRRFKNKVLQQVYDYFRANKPLPNTRSRGGCHNAYYVGRYVYQKRPTAIRTSPAYAAWAAGVDNFKDAQRKAGAK